MNNTIFKIAIVYKNARYIILGQDVKYTANKETSRRLRSKTNEMKDIEENIKLN